MTLANFPVAIAVGQRSFLLPSPDAFVMSISINGLMLCRVDEQDICYRDRGIQGFPSVFCHPAGGEVFFWPESNMFCEASVWTRKPVERTPRHIVTDLQRRLKRRATRPRR